MSIYDLSALVSPHHHHHPADSHSDSPKPKKPLPFELPDPYADDDSFEIYDPRGLFTHKRRTSTTGTTATGTGTATNSNLKLVGHSALSDDDLILPILKHNNIWSDHNSRGNNTIQETVQTINPATDSDMLELDQESNNNPTEPIPIDLSSSSTSSNANSDSLLSPTPGLANTVADHQPTPAPPPMNNPLNRLRIGSAGSSPSSPSSYNTNNNNNFTVLEGGNPPNGYLLTFPPLTREGEGEGDTTHVPPHSARRPSPPPCPSCPPSPPLLPPTPDTTSLRHSSRISHYYLLHHSPNRTRWGTRFTDMSSVGSWASVALAS
ncbi:hypothetical protein T439DRAFT_76110 [Meredithblackwellia eburnea MCA 4105]